MLMPMMMPEKVRNLHHEVVVLLLSQLQSELLLPLILFLFTCCCYLEQGFAPTAVVSSALASPSQLSITASLRDPRDRPNFVVFFIDDLGYGDINCFGAYGAVSPNIDLLAFEGMKLTQWYSGAVVCTPSRATLLTGRLAIRSGMTSHVNRVLTCNAQGGLPENETTFAQLLQDHGYATAAFGKWHLGQRQQYLPTNRGFDFYYGVPYSVDMGLFLPPHECNVTNFQCTHLPLLENTTVVKQPVFPTELSSLIRSKAISWIDEHRDVPFLAYIPTMHAHKTKICNTSEEALQYQYAGSMFAGKSKRGIYGDAVAEMDWLVGGVMQKLKELELDRNTLVLWTSDQGPPMTGTSSYRGTVGPFAARYANYSDVGKGSTWEGGMRVPALAWWPGQIRPHSVSDEIVSSMDIFPTLLKLARIPMPSDRVIDGKDLMPIFTENALSAHQYYFLYRDEILFAVRHGPYKVHFWTKGGLGNDDPIWHDPPLVFNVQEDVAEEFPLDTTTPDMALVLEDVHIAVAQHNRTLTDKTQDQLAQIDAKYSICCNSSTNCVCGQK